MARQCRAHVKGDKVEALRYGKWVTKLKKFSIMYKNAQGINS